jgi:uncharacterized protein (DUF427 family)
MIGARLRSLVMPGVRAAVTLAGESGPDRAEWRGAVLAESIEVRTASGYVYFPPRSVRWEYLEPSDDRTTCGWKGIASYYDVGFVGQRNANAAWSYPEPLPRAEELAGRVAFWGGVEVTGHD